MLNFKITNLVFLIVLGVLIVANVAYGISFTLFALVIIIYLIIVVYGSYSIQQNFFLPSFSKADTKEKIIAITFDDGPEPSCTSALLDILKKHRVEAAFFCIGKNISGNESLLKRMNDEGHIVGNHSYSHHFWFDFFSAKKMLDELRQTDTIIQNAIGNKPKLFRPPYGVTNPNIAKAIQEGHYTSIGWSVRTYDTVQKNKEKLLQKITENIQPGDIFLFHDHGIHTVGIISDFIVAIESKGFKIVRADKLLEIQPYA
jgi:peptidoglycan-N-acetylglucosamine deacetylase